MQVTHESVSGHMVKITIKESSTEMEHYKKLAALEIAEARQFPGFRKGDDVPTEVVAREIGEDRLMQEALNRALQTLYPKALKKLSIHPVDMGEISDIASISPLEVTLMIEVVPEIALDIKKTEKIRVPMPQVSVSDEDLEAELAEMLKRGTHYHPRGHHHGHTHDENGDLPDSTDTAIQMHDKVRVNAVGYDKK